jgi:hypothetical protein
MKHMLILLVLFTGITFGQKIDSLRNAKDSRAPIPIVRDTTFTWDDGDQGWTRTNDFVRSNSFSKLHGPYSGYSMLTESPGGKDKYTEGAYAKSQGYSAVYPGANLLISPWFDLSGMPGTEFYISFVQSISVEPTWDGSWWEYTIDGAHWKHLGKLNDPDGNNWYDTAVYTNAQSGSGDPPDTMTMKLPRYALFGPGTGVPSLPFAFWTSNGSSSPTGPAGWVMCQLKVTSADYPDLVHAAGVQFRYVAFSDAAMAFEGWAVDNFRLGSTASKSKK